LVRLVVSIVELIVGPLTLGMSFKVINSYLDFVFKDRQIVNRNNNQIRLIIMAMELQILSFMLEPFDIFLAFNIILNTFLELHIFLRLGIFLKLDIYQ
jgi:hypothetical protein